MEASQPQPEQPQTVEDLLRAVLAEQTQHRAEVAALRAQINAGRPAAPAVTTVQSQEELVAARANAIAQHPYYCPACGRLYDYQRECIGRGEAPHPATEVVSTDELKSGDPSQHTVAPVAA